MSNVSQLLGSNVSCVDVLGYLLGLNSLESQLYFHLLQNGKKTVSELQGEISRKQSTTHVALQKLVSQGITVKTKRSKKPKGYEFVYSAIDPQDVKIVMLQRLDAICRNGKICVETFDRDSLLCEIAF